MESEGWWADWDETSPIRQGDVLRRSDGGGGTIWRLIVTADCDIVQQKAGDRFTWIEIVPAVDYLRTYWAPDQIRRFITRQARPAAEALSGHIRRAHAGLDPLGEESLLRWLAEDTPEAVWAAATGNRPAEVKTLRALAALKIATAPIGEENPLDRLRRTWAAAGRNAPGQAAAVREAFEGERGFPDFFLLPDLPLAEEIGHVALLREIASVDAASVFRTERDARIAGRPDAFHRVARLHDGVRFAITQKLAFLFSRIGMPTRFEHACTAATDLVVEAAGFGERTG